MTNIHVKHDLIVLFRHARRYRVSVYEPVVAGLTIGRPVLHA